jgi:ubiquinone/menaquinone biosynthesis C-methylase UbiE
VVFKKLLEKINGGEVLDVGCGTGQFIGILLECLGSFSSFTGVDVDVESLAEARENYPGNNYRFLESGSDNLPFENECFDLVSISKALHHVEDPVATLDEMKRVLKPGGYLIINEMHRNNLTQAQKSHMMYHHLRADIDNMLGISHNYTFTREHILRLSGRLELGERVIAEFSPDASRARQPEEIKEFSRKMDGWLTGLDGHEGLDGIRQQVDSLKERFLEHGISRQPQLVILGIKE